jgi:dihydroorotase-like cyclic amidohydrolase
MSQLPFDIVLAGGSCVTPSGIDTLDIGIRAGRIAAIGQLAQAARTETIDVRGLHVLPGVIDSQVHFREPGLIHKEDLESGTRGAALGGVTAIFEMPNTSPATTTREALAEKLRLARGRCWVDHAFFMGAAAENADQLGELESLPGCAGVMILRSCGARCAVGDAGWPSTPSTRGGSSSDAACWTGRTRTCACIPSGATQRQRAWPPRACCASHVRRVARCTSCT